MSRGTIELLFGETADVEGDLVGRWRGGAVSADDPRTVAAFCEWPEEYAEGARLVAGGDGRELFRGPGRIALADRSWGGQKRWHPGEAGAWPWRAHWCRRRSCRRGGPSPARAAGPRPRPASGSGCAKSTVEVALFALLRRQERPAPHARALDDDGTARAIRLIGYDRGRPWLGPGRTGRRRCREHDCQRFWLMRLFVAGECRQMSQLVAGGACRRKPAQLRGRAR